MSESQGKVRIRLRLNHSSWTGVSIPVEIIDSVQVSVSHFMELGTWNEFEVLPGPLICRASLPDRARWEKSLEAVGGSSPQVFDLSLLPIQNVTVKAVLPVTEGLKGRVATLQSASRAPLDLSLDVCRFHKGLFSVVSSWNAYFGARSSVRIESYRTKTQSYKVNISVQPVEDRVQRVGQCLWLRAGSSVPPTYIALPWLDYNKVDIEFSVEPGNFNSAELYAVGFPHRLKNLVIDNGSRRARAMLSSLDSSNYEGARAAGRDLGSVAEQFLKDKLMNPYEAAVGGYLLLKTGDFDRLHDWSHNLSLFFPWFPDGSVISGCHTLLNEGRMRDAAAKLVEVLRLGYPVFKPGIRLCYEALGILGDSSNQLDEETLKVCREARQFLWKALNGLDKHSAYTVLAGLSETFDGRPPAFMASPRKPPQPTPTRSEESVEVAHMAWSWIGEVLRLAADKSGAKRLADALEKSIIEPYFLLGKARAEAQTIRELASAEYDAQVLRAQGEALATVIRAEAEARADELEAEAQSKRLQIASRAYQRLQVEEIRNEQNLEKILNKTVAFLPASDGETADAPLDEDWVANFFSKCRIYSNEEMQTLWAKILSSEVVKPGSFSKQAVDTLAKMDVRDARSFAKLCKFVWHTPRPTPVYFADDLGFQHDLPFDEVVDLQSLGLVMVKERDQAVIGVRGLESISYFGKVVPLARFGKPARLKVGHILFTRPGRELFELCRTESDSVIYQAVVGFWQSPQSRA